MTEFELADEFLPVYDVDAVAVVVDAEPGRTWHALMAADLIELGRRRPLVGALGALRGFPRSWHRCFMARAYRAHRNELTLHDTAHLPAHDGGWVLLGERPGRVSHVREPGLR